MKRACTIFTLCALSGCSGEDSQEGTVVGNPGDTAFRVAGGDEAQIERAWGSVSELSLVDCNGQGTVVEMGSNGEDIDFLEDPGFEWPAGDWCEAAITFDEPLYIQGVLFPSEGPNEDEDEDEEFEFELILSVETVEVITDNGFAVDGNNHVFELGTRGWINPWLVDLDREDLVVTDEEHPLHDELAHVVTYESGLFEDDDGSGFLNADEYDAGPIAQGDSRDEDEPDLDEDEPAAEADLGAENVELSASKGGCGRSDFSLAWLLPLCVFGSRRLGRCP